MPHINVLSEETIDKIAAGEVVERPASIVKELLENSIDAGATAVTVEIKEGGISFIRITDNGSGIEKEDIPKAFLRHATSKITDASDLSSVLSLGFRGEALSSIAAIAQVELMTKTKESLIGTRYVIEGAKEIEMNDIGVPGGTTIIVRNIFFNTPVRRKFLKSAITEGNYVAEVCEHIALSRPDISIKFIAGGQVKFHTSGSGDLKELIYRLFGKDVAGEVIPINYEGRDIKVTGYLGKPVLNRSTRNYENYFINGRYIKSKVIANAVEEGYREYLMQHKFPFFIINLEMDTTKVDVNVHPTKMDVRFSDEQWITDMLSSAVKGCLQVREMIPDAVLTEEKEELERITSAPEPYEDARIAEKKKEILDRLVGYSTPQSNVDDVMHREAIKNVIEEAVHEADRPLRPERNVIKSSQAIVVDTAIQMNLFEDKLLTMDAMSDYRLIGQVFDTYWLIECKDKLMVMDQHAAHEKVKYEALIRQMKDSQIASQMLNPPIVISLSPSELSTLLEYKEHFNKVGFEIDEFGGMEIKLMSIPMDLYGKNPKELFLEILDELSEGHVRGVPEVINEKIASMACKAAVKGNNAMTEDEVWALLEELLKLDNPYNCPHGRPTIFTMSKYEMEKRFKRIV